MAAADTARLIAELTLDSKKYNAGLKRAQGATNQFESSLGKVGSSAGKLGAGLAKAGTRIAAGLGIGLAGAAKAAIDWEDAFTGVLKTVDESTLAKGTTFRDLELSLRNLATTMPNTAAELASIAELGGAMGIAGKDIEAFTEQVAILASTTNVGAEDAAASLGQLTNIIGLTGDEFDNFAATLVDLGNKGSSTEAAILEITRRSGSAAKLFGVAKDQTIGWAAAVANLGENEELAGTALQNLFVKLLPKFNKGTKDLQKLLGKSAKEIKKSFKEDASGALEDFIIALAKLPKDARLETVQQFLGKNSGLTRVVLGLADSVEKNLAPSLDTAGEAWQKATAAQDEFDKKNKSVRSAISRLRNGIYEAGITLGEGFVPALGRAADKLSKFLASGENRKALMSIGEDIGEAIDGINWDEVLDGARTFADVLKIALDYAKRIFDAFNSLPTEVKAAIAALAVTDKLSGGLVSGGLGGIVGGLGESLAKSLAARIPLFGSAFVQPVFVTNMVPGGLGGPGAIPKAGGVGAAVAGAGLGTIVLGAGALAVISQGIADAANEVFKTSTNQPKFQAPQLFNPIPALNNILEVLKVNDNRPQPVKSPEQIQMLATANQKLAAQALEIQRQGERGGRALDAAKAAINAKQQETTRETTRGAAQTAASAQAAGAVAAGATLTAAAIISATIRANRPVISVQNVTRTYNRTTNYGPTSGSKNANSADSNYGPN